MLVDKSIQTEEHILKEEQDKRAWDEKYGLYKAQAYDLMEELLATKTPQAKQQILDFFEDTEIVKALTEVNDFAYMIVMMEIYAMEHEAGARVTVFDWADSLQGVIDIIRQVKFLLWEIEFLDDMNSGQLLKSYISQIGISVQALEYLVYISSYNKQKMVAMLNILL